jgi:trehalose 6-phosphate phosphatase
MAAPVVPGRARSRVAASASPSLAAPSLASIPLASIPLASPPAAASPLAPPPAVLPPIGRAALLLDFDGTLVDIAPTPDAVVVPPELTATLRALRTRLDGALAVISGRPVEQIEALLGDAVAVIAGEHGGAIRFAPGEAVDRIALPTPPEAWFAAGARIAATRPGVTIERKTHGFVLHYRAAPAAGPVLGEAMAALVAGSDRFVMVPARKAWELRPRGADKGTAVEALMRRAPFAGRVPVFVGDDVTDEDGMAAVRRLGGVGLRVADTFATPAGVRAWLRAVAAG